MIQIYDFVLIAWVPLSSFTLHWGTFSSTENCETAVKLISYSNYHKRSTCDESFLSSISKELIVVLITDDLIFCKNLDASQHSKRKTGKYCSFIFNKKYTFTKGNWQ